MLTRAENWLQVDLRRVLATLFSFLIPAYSIGGGEMRPVTKITVFGVRLGIAALAVYWLLLFVGTHLPGTTQLDPQVNDKVQHFSAFFLLGTLLCYVTTSERWLKRFITIGCVGMLYAGIDELTQRWIPGRYPDVLDFVADSLGLWSAIGCYIIAKLAWAAMRRTAE